MFKHGDLDYVLRPYMEIGMFEPKSGTSKEVTVVNFFLKEDEVIEDFITFFNYMPLKNYIDATPSNYVDTDGNYTVFVELSNTDTTFEDIVRILYELTSTTNLETWKVKVYKQKANTVTKDMVKAFYK